MSDLHKLAKPFPDKYVRRAPSGKYGSYVPHHTIAQALLATVGPYDLVVKEVVRGVEGKVEGAIVQLGVTIDGRYFSIEEAGDCEQPDNWKTEGARLKDAVSDGIKRCAARIGLGLHLWSQDDYFLYDSLTKKETTDEQATPQASGNTPPRPAPSSREKADHPVRPVSKEEVVPSADESGEELSEEGRSSPVLVAKRMQVKILMQDKTPDNIDSLSEKELEALIGKHSKGGKK